MGKFSALGHATRPSYGGPKFDLPDFPLDFALWNFASQIQNRLSNSIKSSPTFGVGPRAEGGQIDLRIFKNKE